MQTAHSPYGKDFAPGALSAVVTALRLVGSMEVPEPGIKTEDGELLDTKDGSSRVLVDIKLTGTRESYVSIPLSAKIHDNLHYYNP